MYIGSGRTDTFRNVTKAETILATRTQQLFGYAEDLRICIRQ